MEAVKLPPPTKRPTPIARNGSTTPRGTYHQFNDTNNSKCIFDSRDPNRGNQPHPRPARPETRYPLPPDDDKSKWDVQWDMISCRRRTGWAAPYRYYAKLRAQTCQCPPLHSGTLVTLHGPTSMCCSYCSKEGNAPSVGRLQQEYDQRGITSWNVKNWLSPQAL